MAVVELNKAWGPTFLDAVKVNLVPALESVLSKVGWKHYEVTDRPVEVYNTFMDTTLTWKGWNADVLAKDDWAPTGMINVRIGYDKKSDSWYFECSATKPRSVNYVNILHKNIDINDWVAKNFSELSAEKSAFVAGLEGHVSFKVKTWKLHVNKEPRLHNAVFGNGESKGSVVPAEKQIKVSSESASLLKAFVNKSIKELDADPNITTFFIDTDKEYKKYSVQIPGICLVHADESMTLAALKKIPLIQKFDKSKTLMRYSDWKKGKVGDIEGVSWYCIYVSAKEARDNEIKALKEGVNEMERIGYLNENGDIVLVPKKGDLVTISGEPYIVESVDGQTVSLMNEETQCESIDSDLDVRVLELIESTDSGSEKNGLVCLGESEMGMVYADENDNVYLLEKVEMYWAYRNGNEVVLTGERHDGLIEYWDLKGKLYEVPEEEFEKKFKKGSAKDLDLFEEILIEAKMPGVDIDRQNFEEWLQSQDDGENPDEADRTFAKLARQAAEAVLKGQDLIFKGKNLGKVVEIGDGIYYIDSKGKKRAHRNFVNEYDKIKFQSSKTNEGCDDIDEADLTVEATAVNGRAFTVHINGKKYSYFPLEELGIDAKELKKKFDGIAKHSVGRALAWLKKNATTKDSYKTK